MKGIIDLNWVGLLSGYIISLVTLTILIAQKTNLYKKFLISLARMSIQLLIIGYVLDYIFDIKHPLLIAAILLVMSFSSAHIIISNSGLSLKKFFPTIVAIVLITILVMTSFFLLVIVQMRSKNIFSPQYLVAIAGMLLGNSMNASVLGLRLLKQNIKEKSPLILQKLAYGATLKETIDTDLKEAYKTALLPNLSSMAGVGLVSLPGMMTGQILSGTSPLIAVKYQLAIMLAISGTIAICSFLILRLNYKKFFNLKIASLLEKGN